MVQVRDEASMQNHISVARVLLTIVWKGWDENKLVKGQLGMES